MSGEPIRPRRDDHDGLVRPFVEGSPVRRCPADAMADAASDAAAARRPASAALVRHYARTGGRTRSRHAGVGFETMLVTAPAARHGDLGLQRGRIARRCTEPCSVVELAVELGLPVTVVRVVAGDMAADGLLDLHVPERPAQDVVLLRRLIAGVRAL